MIDFDLHIHTKFSSDGEFGIAEIINLILNRGINYFSVTDHNSVRGIEETFSLIQDKKIGFIPGIEIDCDYKGINLHVLGYGIDWTSEDFEILEKEMFSKEMDSFAQMIVNLNELGFCIDEESVLAKAKGKQPTAELVAEVMLSDSKYHTPLLRPYMEGGERSDMPYINFYLNYFAQGKPAFVPIEFMDYINAIEIIKDNGGTPVVAHPGLNLKGREYIVDELLNNGAEGLEVFNNYHSIEQIDYFVSVIRERNGIMTSGSDFHGKIKPLIQIGQFKFDDSCEKEVRSSIQRLTSQRH
ncbi:MAG: PHP domain-containing protein [Tannerella sp.]|jgi:predicted metal-dependent phosphoesterase TrpH|nr:PHP domain-containing protein [Tannerella sp.]